MATAIQVKPDGQDILYKGLKMFRKFSSFKAEEDFSQIIVFYHEYLESPTQEQVEYKHKSYAIHNTDAYSGYDVWDNFAIQAEHVGAKLGKDIIKGAINAKLADLDFEVEDGYIVNPND